MVPPILYLQFDLNNIFSMIRDIGGGIGIVLVLIGAVQALLWKLAFYINLALGIIVTIFFTYFASLLNIGFTGLALIFLVGLGLSVMAAFLGAFLAIVEGYIWSTLGLGIYCLAGGMGLSSSVIASAIGGIVIIAIAAFVGGSLDRWLARALPSIGRSRGLPTGWRRRRSSQRPTEGHSEYQNTRETNPSPIPTIPQRVRPEYCSATDQDFCKVCNMDFVYYGVPDALKCPSCGSIFHRDCLNEFVKLNGTCPGCNRRMETL